MASALLAGQESEAGADPEDNEPNWVVSFPSGVLFLTCHGKCEIFWNILMEYLTYSSS